MARWEISSCFVRESRIALEGSSDPSVYSFPEDVYQAGYQRSSYVLWLQRFRVGD